MTLTLFEHQKKAVEIAATRPRFAWFWSCGTGKTIAMLAACAAKPMKTVVLAPKSILYSAWLKDAEHFPQLISIVVDAGTKNRAEKFRAKGWDICITNNEMFKAHARDILDGGVRRLIVDESSKLKNPTSAITKTVWRFSDMMESVYLLSGTPAPNDGTEYFGQLRALGRGVAGDSFYGFAARFFVPQREKIRVRGGKTREVVKGYRPNPLRAQEFSDLLKGHAWSLRKEDCLDLPGKTDVIVSVPLGEEAAAYGVAEGELRLLLDDTDAVNFRSEGRLMKLRQITGGTVRDTAGEVHRVGTAKLDALSDLLDQIGPEPVVIWAEFTGEIDAIRDLCADRMESWQVIDGRTSRNAGDIAAAFQAGEIQRLICHPQAAGHGITLTRASYAVYYSIGFSYETYEQSRDRIHRAGQTRPCTYYHLVAPDTIDEACLRVVRQKASVSDAVRSILAKGGSAHGSDAVAAR